MRKVTIGLEIHAELKTKTKMFCFCKNDPYHSDPNTNICPVCMAHPGALPTINKEAVRHMLKVGLALGGNIADFTEFDRKSYFYPDMPKAYQISQFKYPFVSGGELLGVEITRVHLEEDTAKSTHDKSDTKTLIDFNRAGVPLMELVTEPTVDNAELASDFAKELQLLLRRLNVSDANMEKGQMRVEANISLENEDGSFGTKVEVKNLNSFKSVRDAIAFEIERQNKVLDDGGEVIQETRGWDENRGVTFSQRKKEGSADYRYFPDPDLPKMVISEVDDFDLDEIKNTLPELPQQTRERLRKLNLADSVVEFFVFNEPFLKLFDYVVQKNENLAKLASNYISTDLVSMSPDSDVLSNMNESFTNLMILLLEEKISSRTAKDILPELVKNPNMDIVDFVERNNLLQNNDPQLLEDAIKAVIEENKQAVEDYKAGNEKALGAIVGQSMKRLKQEGIAADPRKLNEIAKQLITQ